MNTRDLKPKAQRAWLKTILTELNNYNLSDEQVEELLVALADELDQQDGEDGFGTEGWKHTFGLED
jgi:hypothetical protein